MIVARAKVAAGLGHIRSGGLREPRIKSVNGVVHRTQGEPDVTRLEVHGAIARVVGFGERAERIVVDVPFVKTVHTTHRQVAGGGIQVEQAGIDSQRAGDERTHFGEVIGVPRNYAAGPGELTGGSHRSDLLVARPGRAIAKLALDMLVELSVDEKSTLVVQFVVQLERDT